MKILVASSNAHKIGEIKQILKEFEVFGLDEVLKPVEIVENGESFKENATIKALGIFNKLSKKQKDEFIVLSDDSGLCVSALNDAPGIFSARFSKQKTDAKNREKLINELEKLNLSESKAYFCACVVLASKFGVFSAHGFLHGKVINEERGEKGFGYDSLFIPLSLNKTLAELKSDEKNQISHRFKALSLAKIYLENIINLAK